MRLFDALKMPPDFSYKDKDARFADITNLTASQYKFVRGLFDNLIFFCLYITLLRHSKYCCIKAKSIHACMDLTFFRPLTCWRIRFQSIHTVQEGIVKRVRFTSVRRSEINIPFIIYEVYLRNPYQLACGVGFVFCPNRYRWGFPQTGKCISKYFPWQKASLEHYVTI